MNRIYRLVFRVSRGDLVAASELASSHNGSSRSVVAGSGPHRHSFFLRSLPFQLCLALGGSLALFPGLSWATGALPTGGTVVAGQASIQQSGNALTVTQSSSKAILNWQSFSIGAQNSVTFQQPNSGSVALNRVIGNDPSAIYGHLTANGQVFLVNPNGILFAPGSQVNAAGIVASTKNISNKDFLDGNFTFSGDSTAGVTNAGSITVPEGGYVAFISEHVDNTGSIQTPGGETALGAGNSVTLTLAGNSLESFTVSQAALNAEVQNGGAIYAPGGKIVLTAEAKATLLQTVVNNTGVLNAETAKDQQGTIELLGGDQGTVQVGGTLDASAPNGGNGGTIETSGHRVDISEGAQVTAQAGTGGTSGTWLVDPVDLTIGTSAASTIMNTLNSGTSVTEQTTATGASGEGTQSSGQGAITVAAPISWTNAGANLTLDAYNGININASISGAGELVLNAGMGTFNLSSGATISASPWLVYADGPSDISGSLTPSFIQYDAPYSTAPVTTGNGFLFSSAPVLQITGLTGTVSKTYDGTTVANISGSNVTSAGLVDGDILSSITGSFGSANAGSHIAVSSPAATGNGNDVLNISNAAGIPVYGYQITGGPVTENIGQITPAPLSISIVNNPTKVYDGTTTATLTAGNYSITGFMSGQGATVDEPQSIAYLSANAGTEEITASIVLANLSASTGTNLSNYSLPVEDITGTGEILQAPVYLRGLSAESKTYDGNTSATLNTANVSDYGILPSQTGDVTVSLSGATGSFATADAGTNIAVAVSGVVLSGTGAGNYTIAAPAGLVANITPKSVFVGGVSATNKTYDGTTTDTLSVQGATLSGVLTQDAGAVSLVTSGATGNFSQSNVGNDLDVAASGFALTGAEAGNYQVTQPTGLTADITPAPLTITLSVEPSKTYDGSASAAVPGSDFTITGFVTGQGGSIINIASGEYSTANAGAQSLTAYLTPPNFSASNGTLFSNYSFSTSITGVGVINPAPLQVSVNGNPSKVYDGNTDVPSLSTGNFSISGFVTGQGAQITQTVGTYASANAGAQTVSVALSDANYNASSGTLLSNYILPTSATGSGTIFPKALTANYITAAIIGNPTKSYDGNTSISVPGSDISLSGFVTGQGAYVNQTVAGSFASANAGTQNLSAALTSSDFSANSGTDLSNYVLPTIAYGTGTINPDQLTVSIVGDPSKIYDGTNTAILTAGNYTISGFISNQGGAIVAQALATYASVSVGTNISIAAQLAPVNYSASTGTLLSNYVLPTIATGSGQITPASVYVTNIYANSKTYDNSTSATLATSGAGLYGVIAANTGDVTLVVSSYSASFATADAGTGIGVSVFGISITGSQASNYVLQPITGLTANITPAPLSITGVTAQNKTYDNSTAATLNVASAALSGVITGAPAVSLSSSNAAGTFSTANAGNNIGVTATGFALTGAGAGNYQLTQPQGLVANIAPATITATITGNPTKVYSDSQTLTLTAGDYTLSGFVAGQGATVPQSATAQYNSSNAGTSVGVSSTLVLSDFAASSGTDLANYDLPTSGAGYGTITRRPLTVAIIGNPTKTYDATTALASGLTTGNYTLQGLVGTQSISVLQTVGSYSSANAGVELVSASLPSSTDFSAASGTLLSNYILPTQATGNGTITPALLTVTGVTAATQTYGENPAGINQVTLSGATLVGTIYSADVVTLSNDVLGTLAHNGNVGTSVDVTTAMVLSGSNTNNYELVQPTGITAVINPKQLTATVVANKTYDGTNTAYLGYGNTVISGFVTGQGASVNNNVTGTYAQANVGTSISISGPALTTDDLSASNGTLLSNYILPASDNGYGNITGRYLQVILNAGTKTYDGTTVASGLTAGDYTLTGFVSGQTGTLQNLPNIGSYSTADVGTSITVTAALTAGDIIYGAGASSGDYIFPTQASGTGAITPKDLTVSLTGVTKTYDGSTTATLTVGNFTSLSGFITGQGATITSGATGSYATANVGTDLAISNVSFGTGNLSASSGTLLSNYQFTTDTTGTGAITPKALQVVLTGVTKTYDGSTVANLTAGNYSLSGFVGTQGDDVIVLSNAANTGSYTTANASTAIVVTGAALTTGNLSTTGGVLLSNYQLPTATDATGTGAITPKDLTVSLTGVTKTYDGSTTATLTVGNFTSLSGFIAGQGATITSGATGSYATANVGTDLAISNVSFGTGNLSASSGTLLSNYQFTADTTGTGAITPKALQVVLTGVTKTYDGTTSVTNLTSGDYVLSGFVTGQGASVSQVNGTYSSANVGSGIGVAATLTSGDFVSNNTSTLLSNYTLPTEATGSIGAITPKALTIALTGTVTKTYDGTTSVTNLTSGDYVLSGFVTGQGASVSQVNGTYSSANVGSGIGVTATLTSGDFVSNNTSTLLSNYTLPTEATGSIGAITPKALTIALTGTVTKTYDGNTTATLTTGNLALTGFVPGQGATAINGVIGSYGSAQPGNGIAVTATVSGSDFQAVSGTDFANYIITGISLVSAPIGSIQLSENQTRAVSSARGVAIRVFEYGSVAPSARGSGSQTLGLWYGDRRWEQNLYSVPLTLLSQKTLIWNPYRPTKEIYKPYTTNLEAATR